MRPSPRGYGAAGRALPLMYALALSALLGACGPDGGGAPAVTAAPAPRTTSPGALCARLVTHWAQVVLGGDRQAGLDYQAMGLSGGQNDILRAVVAAARAEERAQGPQPARRLISRQAAARCAERYRDGGPAGGPWQ